MRSGRTAFLKIALMFANVAAIPFGFAADSAPAPAPAPEKIEFSSSSSTAPKVPRPGVKNDELLKRFGNVREMGPTAPDLGGAIAPAVTAPPSRAASEKMMREWDKKKNWMFPDAQDKADASKAFTKEEEEKNDPLGEKPKSVTERFFDREGRGKASGPERLRDPDHDRDRNRRDNQNTNPNDRSAKSDDRDDKDDNDSRRDPKESNEPNGLAEFNLKNFIRQQDGQEKFLKDNQLPRASQLFRTEIGTGPDTRQLDRDRAQREARSAEFMQMLKPRGSGSGSGLIGVNDPINSPDLSRREMNPITPRALESSAMSRSPFAPPPSSPAARIQESGMFGVTGPAAASSVAPIVNTPLPRPDVIPSRNIIIEPPKRSF
jgi:hypothetical protein